MTVDTLRADHLGCYGFPRDTSPNIDALAGEGVLFEDAYAPMSTTLPSHASLFTGLFPAEHGIRANFVPGTKNRAYRWLPDVVTAASAARQAGYATAAFVGAAPLKRHSGLQAGFDVYDEPTGGQRRAEETVDAAVAWLRATGARPVLLWVHVFDPHSLYEPPDGFDVYRTDDELEAWVEERGFPDHVIEPWVAPEEVLDLAEHPQQPGALATRAALNLYDGEIRYTDGEIGRLFDALREVGLWEDAVLAVTADHGEGLNQHGWRFHGHVWPEQVRVPLVLRVPGGPRGARVGRPVSTVDVMTTLFAAAHPPLARAFAVQGGGVDLLAPEPRSRAVVAELSARTIAHGETPAHLVVTEEWRLLHAPEGETRLFRRADDPHDRSDVSTDHPAVVAELVGVLEERLDEQHRRHRAFRAAAQGDDGATLGADVAGELEALGYVDED